MSNENTENTETENNSHRLELNQITINESNSSRRILITLISVGIIIIVGVIISIKILNKKKKTCVEKKCGELIESCEEERCCDGDICDEETCESIEYCEEEGCCGEDECCEEICKEKQICNYIGCCNGQDCCKEEIKITHKINYINIYDDVVNKTLNLEVNKIGKNRRLEEKNYYTEIKGEYLFNIYNYEIIDNSIIYYAYAALLSLNKTNNNQITVSIGILIKKV